MSVPSRQYTIPPKGGAYINFSEVSPSATRDDIERIIREGGAATSGVVSRSAGLTTPPNTSAGGGPRRPLSLSSHQIATFPTKLHKILSNPNYQHIIRWLPHGRSWEVVDEKAFMKDVAPDHFSFSKYSSFTRQITGWRFVRKAGGKDRSSYYHELFLRGRPHLVKFMKREVIGQANKKAPMDHRSEPDFYGLSKMYPLPELPGAGCAPSAVTRKNSSDNAEKKIAASSESVQQAPGSSRAAGVHQDHPYSSFGEDNNIPDATAYPSSAYAYPYHEGYRQWATHNYNSYYGAYPPTAHSYEQSSQRQGQGQGQGQGQHRGQDQGQADGQSQFYSSGYEMQQDESYYEQHGHFQQHHSSFMFNPHSSDTYTSYSQANPYGYYYGQGNDHSATAPWSATNGGNSAHHGGQYEQDQQQGDDSDQDQKHKSTNETHRVSAINHPGSAGAESGGNEGADHHLPPLFQPPKSSGTTKDCTNNDYLPSLDKEQRTMLLGILGTAVEDGSSKGASPEEKIGASQRRESDEDGTESDVSPIRFSTRSKGSPRT